MRIFFIVLGVTLVYALAAMSTLFSLHILNDPMNTGYLHIGAGAVCVIGAALAGYGVAGFVRRA